MTQRPTSGFPHPNSSTTEGFHRITCESANSALFINVWNTHKYRLLSVDKKSNHSAPVFSHRYREVLMPATKDKNATPVLQAFQKHQGALRRFISRFVQRTQDIDDVAQEAFMRAYRAEKGRPIEQPKSFLFRIAHNVAITELTKKSHQIIDYIADIDESAVVWLEDSAEEQAMAEELIGIHCEAVAHLPPQCRRVFLMRKVHGMSHKEISVELDISISTVEKHMSKGVRACANFIEQHTNGEKNADDKHASKNHNQQSDERAGQHHG